VQATAEADPFTDDQFTALLGLAKAGIADLVRMQRQALGL
jgi:ribonuclease PH